jgi:hypothetical protein
MAVRQTLATVNTIFLSDGLMIYNRLSGSAVESPLRRNNVQGESLSNDFACICSNWSNLTVVYRNVSLYFVQTMTGPAAKTAASIRHHTIAADACLSDDVIR